MERTESDNAQTNWQARGSRSDADFRQRYGAGTKLPDLPAELPNAGAMDKCTTPAWRGNAVKIKGGPVCLGRYPSPQEHY
jgi:hypothetical protein